jgi:CRISPR-associated protein Cas1
MSSDPGFGIPETVPARMVNEFVYCPRLFHLEWVQSRFASNDDVEEGLYVHRVVDQPGGTMPDPDYPAGLTAGRTARSVWVTSPTLRVTAKVDLVEVDNAGVVVPVDYKKGHPSRDGRPWPADRVQSVLQGLVLRDAGYQVENAEIWYDETRQRVRIPLDDEAVASTRRIVADLWEVASRPEAPAPLIDSPKCPRCSLVGICLPDEITTLRLREVDRRRPRRIVPSNPDPQPLYVQEQGAVVGIRGERVEVRSQDQVLAKIRLIDVSQLCLLGNINLTPQVMRQFFAREIPVCWFSFGGWFSGMAHGLPGKNVDLRRGQYLMGADRALEVARKLVEGKIRNSRTLLRRNARGDVTAQVASLAGLASDAAAAVSFPTLLGIEGAAARIYFSRFAETLAPSTGVPVERFEENGRGRRPPPDPVNALLSFTYALLVKDFATTVTAVGMDPYLGVYHRPRFGRPALALDLAEEFRPLIAESVVLQVINNGEVTASDFLMRARGCQLQPQGRRAVLRAYERRLSHEVKHPVFGYRVAYGRAIEVQCRIFAAHALGELDTYTPFTTR